VTRPSRRAPTPPLGPPIADVDIEPVARARPPGPRGSPDPAGAWPDAGAESLGTPSSTSSASPPPSARARTAAGIPCTAGRPPPSSCCPPEEVSALAPCCPPLATGGLWTPWLPKPPRPGLRSARR
jgi:hypothetical protein